MKLGPAESDEHVLGWRIRQLGPDHILLGAGSRIGMPGELLLERRSDAVLFSTFVQQRNPVASTLWASIEAMHVRVVRDVLERASRRARPGGRS